MSTQRLRPRWEVVRRGFIHSYGLFWNADGVPWSRRESEVGERYRGFWGGSGL
jgi:hypothetical protein